MRILKKALALSLLLGVNNSFAFSLPDGDYQLAAVDCNNSEILRYANPIKYKQFKDQMIQANVPDRDSLSAYYFSYVMHKSNKELTLDWTQLHTGNATNDARNHAPFYVSFTTKGTLQNDNLVNMHLVTSSIHINYLEHEFNGQEFTDEDITGRMAKDKHLGEYSTKTHWGEIKDPQRENKTLVELTELDGGFGAPRHLLCGNVHSKMKFLLTPIKVNNE